MLVSAQIGKSMWNSKGGKARNAGGKIARGIRERSNVGVEAPLTAQQEHANGQY
jgi:hypothetical protein